MARLPTAALLAFVLALGAAAQGGPAATVGVHGPVAVEADLHGLCEALLRACGDLDPADFGMTAVPVGLPSVDAHASAVLGGFLAVGADAGWTDGEGDGASGQVPCADAPHCPDLIVDPVSLASTVRLDTRAFAADHCAVAENSTAAGTRTLLRFDFVSPNIGLGDLEVGRPADHPEWFEWGTCHGHWHFSEYADYRLWDPAGYAAWQAVRAAHPGMPPAAVLAAYPELLEHMVAGHKQGFCIIDFLPWGSPVAGTVNPRQFRYCSEGQGITSFWADKYSLFLDGQWVDVTGLAPGPYVLEAEVNPERLYVESDYANNAAAVLVVV
ncbi:MAG: serine protease [Thermoplasmata archaeon]|jgi:hypothetical protein|nr:serine protease [Thermoplasmata archaeon]